MKHKSFDLEYNSQRENLIISEYGRHVQSLVNHAKTIEDKEERQAHVEEILNLMSIMVPSNKSLVDQKAKMWNHIFKIANYELDVDVPDGIEIYDPSTFVKPKSDLSYPTATYKFRHYGSYIQDMISKARKMEDQDMKEGYSEVIASYMKLAYQTWNKEHYVNDNVIKQDLEEISEGDLTFEDDYSIENLVSIKALKNAQFHKNKKGGKSNKKSTNNNRKRR